MWSARDAKRIRKRFDSLEDAKRWRAESYGKLRWREMRAPSAITFGQAAELWLAGVRVGSIRTRSVDLYKPSTIRSYELALRGPSAGGGRAAPRAREDQALRPEHRRRPGIHRPAARRRPPGIHRPQPDHALRRGELMGLRWCDVDFARGVIDVVQAWDPTEQQMVRPKSAAGACRVPIAAALVS